LESICFIVLAIVLCVFVHISACAAAGAGLGVTPVTISYGIGPVILRGRRILIKALPLSGYVKFKELDDLPLDPADTRNAFDTQTPGVQLLIAASGCIALLLIALAAAQFAGLRAFAAGFVQIIAGALAPMGHAQTLLAQAWQAVAGLPFLMVLGLVAAKLAAFNLLPLPALNGGFIAATVGRRIGLARLWPAALTQLLLLAFIAVIASWAFALVLYVARQF
jgi:membrane-associated protease RseP (regulator of RpoE activity)